MKIVKLEKKVLRKNEEIASENRSEFRKNKLSVHNLIGSPGSGKTSVIERIVEYLAIPRQIGVVEGDCQTDRDAQRIEKLGVPVVQVVTEGGCHLNAAQVQEAIENLPLEKMRILFIENVGNLVCPTNFDLGEDMKWVVANTTEGDDKPLKYPKIFQAAEVMIINKIDLLPYIDCDLETLRGNALSINPRLSIFAVSGKTGDGIEVLCRELFAEECLRGT